MPTDWIDTDDLVSYLRRYELPMHPRVRSKTASCWFFYSKSEDVYSATIKFRNLPAGKNIMYLNPKKRLSDLVIEAIFIIDLQYA